MKLTTDRKALLTALELARKVRPGRTFHAVLSNVRLTAEADRLTVTATDLETWAVVPVPATVETPGAACLPIAELTAAVKASPADAVTIETAAEGWTVTVAGAVLSSIDPAEYPETPTVPDDSPGRTVPTATLADLFNRTAFAVSTNEARPAMMGLLMEFSKRGLQAVATDGHRLAMADADLEPGDLRGKLIVPVKALAAGLPKKAKDGDALTVRATLKPRLTNCNHCNGTGRQPCATCNGKGKVRDMTSLLIIDSPAGRIITRLIEGPYPDYERVIPKGYPLTVKANRDELAAALSAVLPFCHPVGRVVACRFNGAATLTGTNPDAGSLSRTVPCETVGPSPADITIGFNAGYLLAMLKHCGPTVKLELSSPLAAAYMPTKRGGLLLMPIRLD